MNDCNAVLEIDLIGEEIENKYSNQAAASELGRLTAYDNEYNPKRLFPIPRAEKRLEIGIDPRALPFYGFDCWTHYEVSWLNRRGKPEVAVASIHYDAHSPMIVESKSLKLYFNSLNQSQFATIEQVEALVTRDLETILGAAVQVRIERLSDIQAVEIQPAFTGICLDSLDVACDRYQVHPDYLTTGSQVVTETLYSDLLKSNCLVTNQPDWGSVQISYTGKQIDREGLLRYIVSFRNHNEFHEQCIERIFMDISRRCQPTELTVYGRYTRRGGLDINPIRSSRPLRLDGHNLRLIRQ